jgi:hypothetical protein
LLAYGAPLFETNIAKKTPMESAVDAKQMIIAQFLESQMVITADEVVKTLINIVFDLCCCH